jgi:phospholipid transport system substrate-binding protein
MSAEITNSGKTMRSRLFRSPLVLLTGLLLALTAFTASAKQEEGTTEQSPQDMVQETSDAVLALIAEAKGYAEDDPERFYQEVQDLLDPVMDFDSFSRSVMAVHSRKASDEQLRRFSDTFRTGLVRTYAMALTEFEDGEVVVVPPDRPPRNPQRQTVKMEIRMNSGEVYPVLYSVVQSDDGRWQIRNLIVNGVNMGLTYRNQFNSAMGDPKYGGDMDKVIDSWGGLIEEAAPDLDAESADSAG